MEIFDKCTVAKLDTLCGLAQYPLHGMGKMATGML